MESNLLNRFSEYDRGAVNEAHRTLFQELSKLDKLKKFKRYNIYLSEDNNRLHSLYLITLAKVKRLAEELDYIFFEE